MPRSRRRLAGAWIFQACRKHTYGSVESGYPALVLFGTSSGQTCHTIPLFGHTFNEDMWVPHAELSYFRVGAGTKYIPSESWLSSFLAHDDNWGSNFCIPRRFLYTRASCEKWPKEQGGRRFCETQSDCVVHVIATMPKEVRVDPLWAEMIGADYLFKLLQRLPQRGNPWDARLREYAAEHLLVLRPILIEAAEYSEHLDRVSDWDGKRIYKKHIRDLALIPPQKLWMIELSVPELFSANRRKVGEVLVYAEVPPTARRDFGSFLLARLPGYFALYDRGGETNPIYRTVASGIDGHVELFACEER